MLNTEAVRYQKIPVRGLWSQSGTKKLQPEDSGASPVPKNFDKGPLGPVWYPKTQARGVWSLSGTQKLQPEVSGASPVPKNPSQEPLESYGECLVG